jgi:hypothetical protein
MIARMRPNAILWTSVGGFLLLVAGLRYFGASPVLILAVCGGLWFALTLGLALVGDRHYVRAFDHPDARLESTPDGHRSLSIGWAILIGEMAINVPVFGLLPGLIIGVGTLLQWATGYDGTGPSPALPSIVAVIVAFTSAWAWWSIVTPRWLLWAMRRVDHPQALRHAAIGSILGDDESKWGNRMNQTLWRTAAMRAEEAKLLLRKAGKSSG